MDAKITIAIIGLAGVLLGSFLTSLLNGIGFALRERYHRIRIVNQTIFYLLKLLHANAAMKNLGKIVSIYSRLLKEQPETKELMTVDDKTLNQYCTQLLIGIINPITQEINEDFKEKFNNSIFELSNVKPVVAYELSRTSYFEALVQSIHQISQNPEYTANQNQEYKESFENGLKASRNHVSQEFEIDLIRDIKSLSWSTNFFNAISCRYKIYKIKQKYKDQCMKSYLEDYFQKVIIPLMEPYKNQKQR